MTIATMRTIKATEKEKRMTQKILMSGESTMVRSLPWGCGETGELACTVWSLRTVLEYLTHKNTQTQDLFDDTTVENKLL
jgi:hypothetical protein